MKVLKKTKVAAGIATAVFATGAAQAATISTPSTAVVPAYGLTIVNEASRAIVSPAATTIFLGGTESLSVDDSVTFALSGGATFAAIASTDLTDNVGNATYSLVSGGVGTSSATFRVNDNPSGPGANLVLAATATVNMASVADSGSTTVTATMSGFVGGIATNLFGSPLTSLMVRATPMMSLTTAGATGTFDVATGFTQLLTTGVTSANSTANVVTSASATTNNTTTGVPAANPTPGLTLLTLSGPMASVAGIADSAAGGLITSATCAGGTPTGGTVANSFWVDTTNDQACAVMAGGANAPGATDTFTPQITFDGTTTNNATAYTLALTRLLDGSYAATTGGSGTLFTFGRNGSAFASNSFGPLNKITVTDRSGSLGGTGAADGAINLTVYDTAGAVVSCTGLTIANLGSNSTVTIQGADVAAACPGAKRVEGTVNSNSILVTNVKTTADGATATPALSSGGATAAQ